MMLMCYQKKTVTCFAVVMTSLLFVGSTFGLDVGKYDTFETNVMNYNSYSNPFQNVTLNATFTSPSSQNTSVRGFYDGNNTWRVRFMPDQLGTWTYTCTFSDGAPGKSGSFSCVAGNLHGPLKTNTATPLWFEHADGTPFFMQAFHLWRPETFTESVLEETLDFMKANGLNVADGPHLANWGTAGNQIPWEGSDYTYYKLSVWRQLDVYIRKCAERGIVVFPFSILGGTNGIPKMSTWDQRQRFIRYWVARWGGFWNVAYCPMSEYAEAYSTAEGMQILNEIYSSDGGRHPVSIHPGNTLAEPATEIKTMTAYTYHTVQEKLNDWNPARYQQLITLYTTANKPIYAQETLWEGNKYQPDSSRDMNNMRKAAWITTTYGGQISYADECMPGHLPQDNDETLCYAMHGASVEPQGWFYPYFSHLGDFMRSVPFWRMSLQPSLASTGNCLAQTDYWYVAYTMGGSFTLNLSAAGSPLIGRWYDPRNGTFGSPFSVSPGGVRTMTPSDSNDWVLYVCRDVDSTPPAAVSSFTVTAGEHKNTLVWTNPSSSDFIATVIRCKTTGYPTSATDGEPVVNLANMPGTSNTYVHSGLNAGATYYYTAFARDDEYHYSTGVQASAVPYDYKRVAVDLGTTDAERGIYNVPVSDGDTTAVDIGGKNCRRNAVAGRDNYIYFGVADAYMYAGYRPDCYIMVEYYDTGAGVLTLQYDSTSGAYTDGSSVTLANSNMWKTHEFHVTDAYFGNRQNNGADFRIACTSGMTFYLNEVSVANVALLDLPPVISPVGWNPDVAYVGAEYVCQLTLSQGRPSPTWTLLQGPTGATVNGSGRVSGWTPSSGEDGQTITFQVEAANSQGSDTEEWLVTVGPAPLVTYEAEGAGMGHLAGSAIPGGWRITPANPNTFSTYGPYTSVLPTGPLTARFWLRVDDNTADNNGICQLDVHDADGTTLLAGPVTVTRHQWTAAGVYQPFELAFTNPGGGHRLEFRTYYLGNAQLDQDRVDVFLGGDVPAVADFDRDGDVDQTDFGVFQACLSGSAVPYGPGCGNADFDGDGAVDQNDFAAFLDCLGGPDTPPGC